MAYKFESNPEQKINTVYTSVSSSTVGKLERRNQVYMSVFCSINSFRNLWLLLLGRTTTVYEQGLFEFSTWLWR